MERKAAFAGITVSSVVAAIFTSHALPAMTAIGPLRRTFFTHLAGTSGSTSVALTFDDGPDKKSTPLFLDALDRLNWKATFFMLGQMAEKDQGLTLEVQNRGHEVALHGYGHKNLLWRTPKQTEEDIVKGYEILSSILGRNPIFYRPPYGVLNSQAIFTTQRLGLTPVLWSSWGRDWRAKATPQSVVNDLKRHLGQGSTLLLHDSDCTSAETAYLSALGALELLSTELDQRGIFVERMCDHF